MNARESTPIYADQPAFVPATTLGRSGKQHGNPYKVSKTSSLAHVSVVLKFF